MLAALVLLATANSLRRSLTSKSARRCSQLVAQNPAARRVSENAIAVLVFPDVVKAGFIFGGQGGEGVLFVHGKCAGRYRTFAASYGLQAGIQKYGYALFFLNQKAVDWVTTTRGWKSGPAPASSWSIREWPDHFHEHAPQRHLRIHFRSKGSDGGVGIQGAKIERTRPVIGGFRESKPRIPRITRMSLSRGVAHRNARRNREPRRKQTNQEKHI